MQAIQRAAHKHRCQRELEQTLKRYGLQEINPDHWYPSRIALDLYRVMPSEARRDAGRKLVDTALRPDWGDDLIKVLRGLSHEYRLNVRYAPDHEGYTVEQVGERHIHVIDHHPYPHEIVEGFLRELVTRYCPRDGSPRIEQRFLNPENPDEAGAVYDIAW